MGLKEDLAAEVKSIFSSAWAEEVTTVVPEPEDLRLKKNHAKNLEMATVLYADLNGSTKMVDKQTWQFSAEIYETYLRCASEIIRSEGGTITAYDGDRIMAIFTGGSKNTTAVRTALKINWAVVEIIRPAMKAQYPTLDFTVNHVIGIDSSQLRVARIGAHNDNDLVWIGRAANHAAKLSTLSEKPLWITKPVHDSMSKEVKFSGEVPMWAKRCWTVMDNREIYCSSYRWWPVS